jgi:hypothetical protein
LYISTSLVRDFTLCWTKVIPNQDARSTRSYTHIGRCFHFPFVVVGVADQHRSATMNSPVIHEHALNRSLLSNNHRPFIKDDDNGVPIKLMGATTLLRGTASPMEVLSKNVAVDWKHRSKYEVDSKPNKENFLDNYSLPHKGKKVQFAMDRKGRVLCEVYRNREPKSKKEMLACFYTLNEFKEFRRECKQEAIMQQKTPYRDHFSAVYAACTTGNFKNVTRERAYISAATCRGLEVVVFPTLHSDRKNMIATVLKTQSSLPNHMDSEERRETIAAASRFLTKQARQLARVLGSGDAAVVIANQRIESLQQQRQQQQSPKAKNGKSKSSKNLVIPHCFVTC